MGRVEHGFPRRVDNGVVSKPVIRYVYTPDDGEPVEFEWDIGHTVVVRSAEGADSFEVGDAAKVTTSRFVVEKAILGYIERYERARTAAP